MLCVKTRAEVATSTPKNNSHLSDYGHSPLLSSAESCTLAAWLRGELRTIRRTLLDPHLNAVERSVLRRTQRSTARKLSTISRRTAS